MSLPQNQTCNKMLKFDYFAPLYFKETMLSTIYA